MPSSNSLIEKKLLHYVGKAIADFNMIQRSDKVLVCLSGGKDSFTLLKILRLLQARTNNKFTVNAFTLNQCQPGWSDTKLRAWLLQSKIPFEIITQNTYAIVKEKIAPGKIPCSFCSRLRRGIIYRYAKEKGFKKIALGHHRDDLIESLLMSMFYSGEICSQPPKLITNDKKHIVIRPLVYCQEKDIIRYAKEQNFPIVPCGFCNGLKESMRAQTKQLIKDLAQKSPKIPSNLLHALQAVRTTQLMDSKLCNFRELEEMLVDKKFPTR